jgi:hypothetical protein
LPTILYAVDAYLKSDKSEPYKKAYIRQANKFFTEPLFEYGKILGGLNIAVAVGFAVLAATSLITAGTVNILGISLLVGYAIIGMGLYASGTAFHTPVSKAMYDIADAFDAPAIRR